MPSFSSPLLVLLTSSMRLQARRCLRNGSSTALTTYATYQAKVSIHRRYYLCIGPKTTHHIPYSHRCKAQYPAHPTPKIPSVRPLLPNPALEANPFPKVPRTTLAEPGLPAGLRSTHQSHGQHASIRTAC